MKRPFQICMSIHEGPKPHGSQNLYRKSNIVKQLTYKSEKFHREVAKDIKEIFDSWY
jgi:hypothetical protein